MFNIDHEVKQWSRKMRPGFLHRSQRLELEDHLHCVVEEFAKQGHSPKRAFDLALAQLGKMESVKAEYCKNFSWRNSIRNPSIQTASLVVGCVVLLAVCMVWRNHEAIAQARSLLVALCDIPSTLFGLSV